MKFSGHTTDFKLPEPPRCEFPGCKEWADHRHHIVYNPDVVTNLCFRHHEEITFLNGQQGRKIRHQLSNRHRWFIWYQFIGGRKVRRTRKSREWTEGWEGQPVAQPEEPRMPETPVIPASTEPMSQTKRGTPKKGRSQRKKAAVRKTVVTIGRRKAKTGKSDRMTGRADAKHGKTERRTNKMDRRALENRVPGRKDRRKGLEA